MTDDYGSRIGKAFAAIWQLHRDYSKLLADLDETLGKGRSSLFGSYVSKAHSKAVYEPDKWMPYEVYRSYQGGDLPENVVEGVMIYFWDEPPKPQEPLLVVGRVKYNLTADRSLEDACKIWDLYWAAFEWIDELTIDRVIRAQAPENERGVDSAMILAAPLFSIGSAGDVVKLMVRVRTS